MVTEHRKGKSLKRNSNCDSTRLTLSFANMLSG
uniref:Uncharacterized protein n=1 Tax=Tetraselmis sp. GSL018 TaxID=582737 RepID=A0A061QN17_9CHLO